MIRRLVLLPCVVAGLLLLAAAPALASGPAWRLTVTPDTDYVISGGHPGVYKVEAENVGDEPTSATEGITIEDLPPAGTSVEEVGFFNSTAPFPEYANLAPFEMCPSNVKCVWPEGPFKEFFSPSLNPGERLIMTVLVNVPEGVEGPLVNGAKVSGGGLPTVEASGTNEASADPQFGTLHFESSITDSSQNPYTQAGGHPFEFTTEFKFGTYSNASGSWYWSGATPVHDPKYITSELPSGLIANPQGVPRCSLADFFAEECTRSTAVGYTALQLFGWTEGAYRVMSPVYNLQPTGSYPGQLGSTIGGAPFIMVTTGLRDGSDYGVTASSLATEANLTRVRFTLWGVPADPAHDPLRGKECVGGAPPGGDYHTLYEHFSTWETFEQTCMNAPGQTGGNGGPAEVPPTPFISMPTECPGDPLAIRGLYNGWDVPDQYAERTVDLPAVDGCNQLSFEPTIQALPTTNLADAPSGLDFNLHVPQNEDPEGVATPALRESVVKFPEGLKINPASADGLAGCSEAQVGLHSEEAAHCPDASKLGTVEVHTRLLIEPLEGAIYLAAPHQNPSGSLLAGYIVVEGQGIRIKLPGSFDTDPQTGQITARFLQNPQLPFEDLDLHLFPGARGALRTPATCGTYETTTVMTPYSAPESGPPATPTSSFTTTNAEQSGAPCPTSPAQEPNVPRFRAGTETPQAGIFSPFSLKLVREDGSQELTSLDTTLPPGLVGKLAGIPYCPDAAIAAAPTKTGRTEQASPSCPASTEVGTVDVGAGAGPTPLNVPGHAYLSGPYKGAPISLAIITPAVAGPFDLGTVVVRTALYVNPETTQIHAVSDPIPTILAGIPLDVRSVTLKMARPKFTLNPTSCEESAFTGSALSVLGVAAPLSQRFQVGGCPNLAFKPKLSLRLKGGTKRSKHPALTAVLKMPAGNANIASAQVTLPHSEFLDQSHIRTICTKVQFAANACPAKSIYGEARAFSPLLDKPLEGPVYLRSSTNKLPDLVVSLNGQLQVVLAARVDAVKGRLRTTFEAVPDAPVSKFVLKMAGGKKGLVVNSQNLCGKNAERKASALFSGQNGKASELEPQVGNSCKHKKRHKHHKRH